MNTTLACHFSRNTWTRERGYPSIKTNIQISIWYNEDRKKLFDKIPPITIADSKKKKKEKRKRSFNFLSEIWNFDAAVPEHQLRRRAERHSRWNLLARIDSAQPLFPIRGKWEATSWWYTVTKSHQSSPGLPKRSSRYTGRAGSCELICQFIRQRNSHWATRAFVDIYIYLFFFLSNPLISLFLFICASSCREVTYTFLIPFHDSIVGDICSNDDQDGDNPQEQATSIFESCDVRGELVIGVGVRSWTRFARSLRFYRRSKSLEIEKDPFPRVSQRRRKEAAPLVRQSGKSRGLEPFRAKAVYIMSVNTHTFGSFFTLEEFRQRFIRNYWFIL